MTDVAFFADRNVIAPAHVALASALAHWRGPSPVRVHFFHSGWTADDVRSLHRTASVWSGKGELHMRELGLERFAHWKNLYGSLMPYGRLLLPDLLPECERVLYMDVDTITEIDLREVVERAAESGPVAAMRAWDFEHSHDAQLAAELGIPPGDVYYYSGMLVLDLGWCRSHGVVSNFLAFGDRHADRLWSHDQSVLNLTLHGRITDIPPSFSALLYPTSAPAVPRQAAVHSFCGAPKPFDPLGNLLNAHNALFRQWLDRTDLAGWSPNSFSELRRLRRNLRLLRPMLRALANRLAGH